MINNSLYGSTGISAYVNSLLAKAGKAADGSNASSTAAPTAGSKSMQATADAALQAASQRFQSSSAQHALAKRGDGLASELKAGLAKAGVALEGAVEFSLDSKGALALKGSEKDKAAVQSWLKGEGSRPSMSSRLVALASDAEQVAGTIRQSAAISQAARYAGSSGNVMSLYTTLMNQQDDSAAVFSFSNAASSLTYPGVLASRA